MSDVLKKLIVDLESGTQQYVDLTPEEIEQRELDAIQHATEQEEREREAAALAEIKESAKSKLAALGLTPDDLKALGL